jgi:hypothetical protein
MADTLSLASALAAQRLDDGSRWSSLLPTRIEARSTEKNDLGMLEPKRRAGRNPFSSRPSHEGVVDSDFEYPAPGGRKLYAAPDEADAIFKDVRLQDSTPHVLSTPHVFEVIVDNVDSSVSLQSILEIFQTQFKSCGSFQRIWPYYPRTGNSHGTLDYPGVANAYRVTFFDEKDQQRALLEMQGVYCGNRPMHVTMPESGDDLARSSLQRDTPGGRGSKPIPAATMTTLYVKDLGSEVNERLLLELFQTHFASCASAKIIFGQLDGSQSNYGLLRFTDKAEAQIAQVKMDGVYCGSKPMSLSNDKPKKPTGWLQLTKRVNAFQPSDDLRTILEHLGVDMYLESFRSEGFERWEQLLDFTESEL